MRDLLIVLMVVATIPLIMKRAWIGVLVWSWLGYMNPHRMTWGFAYDFPFAQLIAIVTFASILFNMEKRKWPMNTVMVVWIMLIVWFNVTTLDAEYPDWAWKEWDRTIKIQLISVLTVYLISTRERLNWLLWTIVLSLGFHGFKGGIFTLANGGQYLVFGPRDSFIFDNNALALALIMTLPLMRYLQMTAQNKYIRWGMLGGMGLTAMSILSSHSRGGFLAGACMLMYLWLKGRHKLVTGIVLLAMVPFMVMFMPPEWIERMQSIQDYQEDGSAMGRINAWWFAWYYALDNPITGGGFQVFSPELFLRYAPEPEDFHDSHSIYFEMMAEQGFVGLGLFLLLLFVTYTSSGHIVRQARKHEETQWMVDLGAMVQVSVVGYIVGGAFLGLSYFDLTYHLVAIVVIMRGLLNEALAGKAQAPPVTNAADPYASFRAAGLRGQGAAWGPGQNAQTRSSTPPGGPTGRRGPYG